MIVWMAIIKANEEEKAKNNNNKKKTIPLSYHQ
jgi:hypothetical protein